MSVLPGEQDAIRQLLARERTIVCVGAGGVGKTTVAAGLAVAAACDGKRVLALTIDPARRLAETLGVTPDAREPVRITDERLGIPAGTAGELWVAVLDAKSTFDALVERYAPDPALRDRILSNKLYVQLSSYLAGTQEYMAMERLFEAQDDARFDLIVLDTPPTQNALQFFEAPDRMVDAIDGSALRWLVNALDPDRSHRVNFLARRVATTLKSVARITGAAFLEQTAELLGDLNSLFGGFRRRAARVKDSLHSGELACVLVTRPEPLAVRDARFLTSYLQRHGIQLGAWVVNRSEAPVTTLPSEASIGEELKRRGIDASADCPRAVREALQSAQRAYEYQQGVLAGAYCPVPRLCVPPFYYGTDERLGVRCMSEALRG